MIWLGLSLFDVGAITILGVAVLLFIAALYLFFNLVAFGA